MTGFSPLPIPISGIGDNNDFTPVSLKIFKKIIKQQIVKYNMLPDKWV